MPRPIYTQDKSLRYPLDRRSQSGRSSVEQNPCWESNLDCPAIGGYLSVKIQTVVSLFRYVNMLVAFLWIFACTALFRESGPDASHVFFQHGLPGFSVPIPQRHRWAHPRLNGEWTTVMVIMLKGHGGLRRCCSSGFVTPCRYQRVRGTYCLCLQGLSELVGKLRQYICRKTSISTCKSTRRYNSEDQHRQFYRHENLISYMVACLLCRNSRVEDRPDRVLIVTLANVVCTRLPLCGSHVKV
jgi:hypothetical protein